jgi:hypothetical protein
MDEIKSQAVPEFDLDRLAKEIDTIFQDKLKDSILAFDVDVSKSSDEWRLELQNILKEHKDAAKYAARNMRDKIMEEIVKGRTTIVLPNTSEIEIQHMDHPKMEDVVKSLVIQKKTMLVGPAGTGKTYMVAEIAKRMNIPFYKYSCSRDSSVHDLLGYKQPKSEVYLQTSFLNAYENGGLFLVDEYDAMSGDMALFFNGIADNSNFISIPHRDDNPTAKKHKDFYLVMCGNTWGKGSTDYSGRDFQDMALMDRFRFCRHHIGYHIQLEKQLMGNYYPWVEAMRDAFEEIGNYLSTRNVEDISILINAGYTSKRILNMVCQDLSTEDRSNIFRKVNNNINFSNEPQVEYRNPQQISRDEQVAKALARMQKGDRPLVAASDRDLYY